MKELMKRIVFLFSIVKQYRMKYGISTAVLSSRNFLINFLNAILFSSIAYAARTQDTNALKGYTITFLVALLLFTIADTWALHTQTMVIHRMTVHIRETIYSRILNAPLSSLHKLGGSSGDILARLNSDVAFAEDILSSNLLYPLMFIVSGVGAVASIFFISPVLLLYLCLIGLGSLVWKVKLAKLIASQTKERQSKFSEVMSLINQILTNTEKLRLMRFADATRNWLMKDISHYKLIMRNQGKTSAKGSFSTSAADLVSYVGVILLGIMNRLEVEKILFVLQLSGMITNTFVSLGDSVLSLEQSAAGLDRIKEMANLPQEKEDNEFLNVSSNKDKAVFSLDNLSVTFENSQSIQYPNIKISPNKITAICGDSGCGKTTLCRILVGLNTEYSGTVQFQGKTLASYGISYMRKAISYLPQNNYFIQGTILDNLMLGNKEVCSWEQIINACKIAGCDDWIKEQPEGYMTMLPRNAESLSGGQKQTLGLARVLLRNTNILVLDEPFSNVDESSKCRILNNLHLQDKTIIIITHNKRIAQNSDCVINL